MNMKYVGFIVLLCLPLYIFAWEGDGTKENPYKIETEEDLIKLSSAVNKDNKKYYNIYFRLENDIMLKNSFNPIGYNDTKFFSGHFDGNNKTISNLIIEKTDSNKFTGLFGCIKNGYIENLTIKNANIKSNRGNVGTIVGYIITSNDSIVGVVNCKVDSSTIVGDNNNIGGIVGDARGNKLLHIRINNCNVSNCKIKGKDCVGGIVGLVCEYKYVDIQDCIVSKNSIITTTDQPSVGHISGKDNNAYNKNKEINLYTNRWNFVSRLGEAFNIFNTNESGNDVAAVQFDYTINNWNENYLYADDTMQSYMGYFVWVFDKDMQEKSLENTITVLAPKYLETNEVVIPKIINNGIVNQSSRGNSNSKTITAHWFALGNPFKTTLQTIDVINNIDSVQGGVVYTFNSMSRMWNNPDTIQFGQGFMVAGLDNSISGKIVNKTKTSSTKNFVSSEKIELICSSNGCKKIAFIKIDDNADNSFDIQDAYVLFSSANDNLVEPYFVVDNREIMINAISKIPYSCPIRFYSQKDSEIELIINNPYPEFKISIIDKIQNKEIILNDEPCKLYINKEDNSDRYIFKISKSDVSMPKDINLNSDVEINNDNRMIYVQGNDLYKIVVVNVLGQIVFVEDIKTNNFHTILNSDIPNGIYLVKVYSKNSNIITKKIIIK